MKAEEHETAEERAARLHLETICASMGRTLAKCMPPGVGFAFVMFDFGGKGNMAYLSTGTREDVIKMLGELRDKIRKQ